MKFVKHYLINLNKTTTQLNYINLSYVMKLNKTFTK